MEVTSEAKKSRTSLVVMDEVEVKSTELCYVTSIHQETRTFFAQFCKFPNKELLDFQLVINKHCEKILADRRSGNGSKGLSKRLHRGDVVCAKWTKDQCWYRATILSRESARQFCTVLYADYGNIEDVAYCDIIMISSEELPEIKRAPFGITCFAKVAEELNQENSNHLLDCLFGNYAMIKVLDRQTNLQWQVEIPKHAYNRPIWDIYKPGATLSKKEDEESGQKKNIVT